MARISERPVKNTILYKISEQLVSYIASIRTTRNSQRFIGELFSESERLMIAKRLAIVVMLEHGYSYVTIKKTLSVSNDTIARISEDKNRGRFKYIEKQCGTRYRPKAGEEDFWNYLEIILQAGMPPQGKGRWRYLDELLEKDRERKQ